MSMNKVVIKTILTFFMIVMAGTAFAQNGLGQPLDGMPALTVVNDSNGVATYSLSLQILFLMTALTVLPSLVLGMTSFTRVIIVLSILRQALGTQQTPPNQVLIAIALFLTFFIMAPTFTIIYDQALAPYLDGQIDAATAVASASSTIKDFMVNNTRVNDLTMFAEMAGDEPYATNADIPFCYSTSIYHVRIENSIPDRFLLFLPFLVIDMVIASTLMSLGMMMLSPMLVSLPFKLLLFVLVDGWAMTVSSLAATYSVT